MSEDGVIQALLNFAISIERILKGILYDINPTYILVSPEFNHSLSILYQNKIMNSEKKGSVLAKEPVADVITFRNSLLRGAEVSRATQKNKNRLFGLSNFRDIIAHHDLSLIDLEKANALLQRDFYFIMLDFSDEINISRDTWFGENKESLINISKLHPQGIENIIRLKLEEDRRNWALTRDDDGVVKNLCYRTNKLLEPAYRYEISCPACNQNAVIFSEPDFVVDTESLEKREAGEFVNLIHCEFVGFM